MSPNLWECRPRESSTLRTTRRINDVQNKQMYVDEHIWSNCCCARPSSLFCPGAGALSLQAASDLGRSRRGTRLQFRRRGLTPPSGGALSLRAMDTQCRRRTLITQGDGYTVSAADSYHSGRWLHSWVISKLSPTPDPQKNNFYEVKLSCLLKKLSFIKRIEGF